MNTLGIDDRLREIYGRSAPVVDEAAFEARLRRSTSAGRGRPSAPKHRSSLRVAVYASIAVVLVAAVAVGSFEAVKHLGKDRAILVIGGDTTNTTAPGAWTDMKPAGDAPPSRNGHSMVYDSGSGKVILFGGRNGLVDLNDTWGYDPTANKWTNLSPAGDVPPGRMGHSMVYDPTSGNVILFGGLGDNISNDTWAYDPTANTWTNLQPRGDVPPARYGHAMVYEPSQRQGDPVWRHERRHLGRHLGLRSHRKHLDQPTASWRRAAWAPWSHHGV